MNIRIGIILICITALFNFVQAQEKPANSIRVGLRAGVYFSRYSYSPAFSAKPKGDDAVYAGIQLQVPITGKCFINAEGLYAVSSASYDGIYPLDEMNYLLTPVMLKYQIGKLGLFAGGQADFLLTAKASFKDFNTGIFYKGLDVSDSSYKKVSFSGVIGAEYVFKYRFGIDIRYHHSLSNMSADNGSTLFTRSRSVKMQAFQAGLFFRFGKKPKK